MPDLEQCIFVFKIFQSKALNKLVPIDDYFEGKNEQPLLVQIFPPKNEKNIPHQAAVLYVINADLCQHCGPEKKENQITHKLHVYAGFTVTWLLRCM